jgi:hypothetical protein
MESKSKIIRKILKYTYLDKKFPTDRELDTKMSIASLHISELEKDLKYIIKRKVSLLFRYKWYEILIRLAILAMGLIIMYGIYYFLKPTIIKYTVHEKIVYIDKSLNDNPIPQGNLLFMNSIKELESTNNYNAVRTTVKMVKGKRTIITSQYWGCYQMGTLARKAVGLESMPDSIIIRSRVIQDWSMNEYMSINYRFLYPYIVKYKIPVYVGVKIGSHLVTVSGLIAAAHLVGYRGAVEFLESDGKKIPCDGNNKPLTDYLQLNNIKLELK